MTRFGRSVGLPAAAIRWRQRHFSAMPPSIAASLDPVVEVPVTSSSWACQRWPIMFTHRRSNSAVCGYSSLSIMFLSAVSDISLPASDGIHVVTNVARFNRALPSSNSSFVIQVVRHLGTGAAIGHLATRQALELLLADHRDV